MTTPDRLASLAGMRMLVAGGSAADAAVAANAVLAVTAQHMCGLGGDLVAVVYSPSQPEPRALLAVGRAGARASRAELLAEGHRRMPRLHDARSVTMPGCVDGWLALHDRYGTLPLDAVLAPAAACARNGFPASPLLVRSLRKVADVPGAEDLLADGIPAAGARCRRPALAGALTAIAAGGRAAWYLGEFGDALLRLDGGWFTESDLHEQNAHWTPALGLAMSVGTLYTPPPPSQGYITLLAAALMDDEAWSGPDDPLPHEFIGAAWAAGHDRADLLGDGTPGPDILDAESVRARRATTRTGAGRSRTASPCKDTIGLCAIDADGLAVALCQSNASGFGARVVVPTLGVWLHNRGCGFSLEDDAPNALTPGGRPAHTLAPLLVRGTDRLGTAALASRGGDTQPQVLLQLLGMLGHGDSPGRALARSRWTLGTAGRPVFESWPQRGDVAVAPIVRVEEAAPAAWRTALEARGHQVEVCPPSGDFGHAQIALMRTAGRYAAAADPRAEIGAALAW